MKDTNDRILNGVGTGKDVNNDIDVIIRKLFSSESGMLSNLLGLDEEDAIIGTVHVIKLARNFGEFTEETSEDLVALRKESDRILGYLGSLDRRLEAIDKRLDRIERQEKN